VTYRNNEADLAAYVDYYTTRFTHARLIFRLFFLAILALLSVQAFVLTPPRRERFQAPIMIAAVVGMWIWFELRGKRRGLAARRRVADLPAVTLTLAPAGITTRNDRGAEMWRAWSGIPRMDRTDKHILIFEAAEKSRVVTAHVIPRRAFATPEAADAFHDAAARWLAEAQRGGTPGPVAPDEADEVQDRTGCSPETISVTFTPTADDARKAHAFYLAQRPAHRWVLWGFTALAVLLTLFNVAVLRLTGPGRRPAPNAWTLWVPLFLPNVLLAAFVALLWWRRRFRRSSAGAWGKPGPITIELSPEGYTVRRGEVAEVFQSWKGLTGIGEQRDFLIIPRVLSGKSRAVLDGHLIPRRAFATPEGAETFLRTARAWLEAAKRTDRA
jgi:hypothetical protein